MLLLYCQRRKLSYSITILSKECAFIDRFTRVISYNSLVFSIDLKLLAISTFKPFDCYSSQPEPDITALFAGPSWGRRGGQAAPDQPLPGAHRHGGHASQKVGTLDNAIPSTFHKIDHSKVDR